MSVLAAGGEGIVGVFVIVPYCGRRTMLPGALRILNGLVGGVGMGASTSARLLLISSNDHSHA